MTELSCLPIMFPEGSEEVLGNAAEGCPVHLPVRTGGAAQAGGAGRLERDETDGSGLYL